MSVPLRLTLDLSYSYPCSFLNILKLYTIFSFFRSSFLLLFCFFLFCSFHFSFVFSFFMNSFLWSFHPSLSINSLSVYFLFPLFMVLVTYRTGWISRTMDGNSVAQTITADQLGQIQTIQTQGGQAGGQQIQLQLQGQGQQVSLTMFLPFV